MLALVLGTLGRQPSPLQAAARALSAAAQPSRELWCTGIKVLRGGKALEVEFNTGERFSLPAEYLRVESPAAGNQDSRDASGRLKVPQGRRYIGIMAVEPIGSYAVRLSFDDTHSAGIFTWGYLHDLGTHKMSRMRRYIRMLRDRGLSRDPLALRRGASTGGTCGGKGSSSSSSSSAGGGKGGGAGGTSSSRGNSKGDEGDGSSGSGSRSHGGGDGQAG